MQRTARYGAWEEHGLLYRLSSWSLDLPGVGVICVQCDSRSLRCKNDLTSALGLCRG